MGRNCNYHISWYCFYLPFKLKVHSKTMTVGSNGAINGSQCTTSLDTHFGLVFCSKILLYSLITHFPGTLSMSDHILHSPMSSLKLIWNVKWWFCIFLVSYSTPWKCSLTSLPPNFQLQKVLSILLCIKA